MKLDYILLQPEDKTQILAEFDSLKDVVENHQVRFNSGLTKDLKRGHAKLSAAIRYHKPLGKEVENHIRSVIGDSLTYKIQDTEYSIPITTYFQFEARK